MNWPRKGGWGDPPPLSASVLSLFVCLLMWSLSSHSYEDVTIADVGLQILTYARQSWPSSSEGSLTCHTYCDTGLLFIMVITEDP